jgi:diguanylate cyclase (GGDEF)-like protein
VGTSDVPTAILSLDIDHFKSINDQHGHPAGDAVLQGIAQALKGALRSPAFCGRLGGEEFLIVLPATDLDTARAAAERLRELVAGTPLLRSPEERRYTVSIGVAVSKPHTEPPKDLLIRADRALYAAKGRGRNCVMTEPPDPPQKLAS